MEWKQRILEEYLLEDKTEAMKAVSGRTYSQPRILSPRFQKADMHLFYKVMKKVQ